MYCRRLNNGEWGAFSRLNERRGAGDNGPRNEIINKVNRKRLEQRNKPFRFITRASGFALEFACTVESKFDRFPSLAPEGPAAAGDSGIVREEIARIRRTLGVLLRQLQKNPFYKRQDTGSQADGYPPEIPTNSSTRYDACSSRTVRQWYVPRPDSQATLRCCFQEAE